MKELFLAEAKANKALPIGGGLWTRFHPEDVIATPYTSWRFDAATTRMPEFTAPGLGKRSNTVTIDLEVGENASGVLYALGGASGGLSLYMDKGDLIYEYNMMIIERYTARSGEKLAPGQHRIEVDTTLAQARRTRRGRHQSRRQGDRPHHGQAHRACGIYRERDLRRRRGPWFAYFPRLLRPAPVRLYRGN